MGNFFLGYILGNSNSQLSRFGGIGGALLILFAVVIASMTLFSLLVVPLELIIHLHYMEHPTSIGNYDFNPIPLTAALTPIFLWPVYIGGYLGSNRQAAISFIILCSITLFICLTHNPDWDGPINYFRRIFLNEALPAIFDSRKSPEILRSTLYALFSCMATLLVIVTIRLFSSRLGDEGRALWLNRLCRPYIYAWNFLSQRVIVSMIAALLFGFMAISSAYFNIDYRNFAISNIEQGAQKHGWGAERVETLITEINTPTEWVYIAFLAILTGVFIWNVMRLLEIRKLRREGPA